MEKEIKGFTLVELLITLTVSSITVNYVIPSFDSIARIYKLRAETNNLISSLYLAKSEAIKRSQTVTIGKFESQNKHWEEGWQIYTDADSGGHTDFNSNEDKLIKKINGLYKGIYILSDKNKIDYISFRSNGSLVGTSTMLAFYICSINEDMRNRKIVINLTGRASVKTIGKCQI